MMQEEEVRRKERGKLGSYNVMEGYKKKTVGWIIQGNNINQEFSTHRIFKQRERERDTHIRVITQTSPQPLLRYNIFFSLLFLLLID